MKLQKQKQVSSLICLMISELLLMLLQVLLPLRKKIKSKRTAYGYSQ